MQSILMAEELCKYIAQVCYNYRPTYLDIRIQTINDDS